MESNQGILASYILSLLGGVIVLVTGLVGLAWFGSGGPAWGGFGGWMSSMMGGYHGFMGGGEFGLFSFASVLGLISGIVMIAGAIMVRSRPQDHLIWGVPILVFALVSFLDMGGYIVGGLLGIAGGALALSYRVRSIPPPSTIA